MSQRNFPPSFWNSSYQPPVSSSTSLLHHQDLPGFPDPYSHMTSSLHSMTSLQAAAQDPWRYSALGSAHSALGSAHSALGSAQPHTYSPHAMPHDFTYSSMSAASSSRFNTAAAAHYSSLLPGSRLSSHMPQCDALSKHTDTWGSRYHGDPLGAANLASHHPSHLTATGLASKYEYVQLTLLYFIFFSFILHYVISRCYGCVSVGLVFGRRRKQCEDGL